MSYSADGRAPGLWQPGDSISPRAAACSWRNLSGRWPVEVTFRPRNAVAGLDCDLRSEVLDTRLEVPILLAPVGSSRLFWPMGEVAASRAAGRAGTAYILSTLSGCRLEEVKAASRGPA